VPGACATSNASNAAAVAGTDQQPLPPCAQRAVCEQRGAPEREARRRVPHRQRREQEARQRDEQEAGRQHVDHREEQHERAARARVAQTQGGAGEHQQQHREPGERTRRAAQQQRGRVAAQQSGEVRARVLQQSRGIVQQYGQHAVERELRDRAVVHRAEVPERDVAPARVVERRAEARPGEREVRHEERDQCHAEPEHAPAARRAVRRGSDPHREQRRQEQQRGLVAREVRERARARERDDFGAPRRRQRAQREPQSEGDERRVEHVGGGLHRVDEHVRVAGQQQRGDGGDRAAEQAPRE
jgi:dTMP kinase